MFGGILSLAKSTIPPPFEFRSNLYGVVNPSIKKFPLEIYGRRKIVTLKTCWRRLEDQQMFAGIIASVLSLIWSDSIWSLFLMEFISKCACLSALLVRNDFRNLLNCAKRFIRITYVRLFNCIIYILSRKRKCKVYLFIWKCLKNISYHIEYEKC